MGAGCVLIATALIFIPDAWKPIAKGVVGFGLILGTMTLAAMIPALLANAGAGAETGSLSTMLGTQAFSTALGTTRLATERISSDNEHWISIEAGLRMFLTHPVFGAGLGAFIHDWPGKVPLVIHSTLVWLLAEFGLVGTAIFLIPVIRLFASEAIRFRRNDTAGYLIILIIAALASMSIFHELLYQRIFWLVLGAALTKGRSDEVCFTPSNSSPR
jgi:hypothetical protein